MSEEQLRPGPEYYRIPITRTPDGRRQFGQPEPIIREPQLEAGSDRAEPVLVGGGSTEIDEAGFKAAPIGPESFHQTPQIDIFTPERPGLSNGTTK